MTCVTYNGHEPMTYLHYIDLTTGRTLTVEPGRAYDVAPAGGNLLSAGTEMPMDGNFVPLAQASSSRKKEVAGKNGHVASKGTMPSRIKE